MRHQVPGWVLPNTARLSPDAAWILKPALKNWIRSPSAVKMSEWLANGARLGWLIDPEARIVDIYRPGFEAETRGGASSVEGKGPVAGLVPDLLPVWDSLTEQAFRRSGPHVISTANHG